jgi:hypothetical protein
MKNFTLDITPAYFRGYTEDRKHVIIDCFLGNTDEKIPIIEKRIFCKILVEGIKNPTKLFIGKTVQPGMATITFCCGKRYRRPFTWLSRNQ